MTIKNIQASFWSRVNVGASAECWEWKRGKTRGYGHLRYKGEDWRAHRLAWTLVFDSIPNEMNVLHSCDNPACCNPNHLFLGTQRDNMIDRGKKGRTGITTVSTDTIKTIKRMWNNGITQSEISRRTGVSRPHVCNIINGKRRVI